LECGDVPPLSTTRHVASFQSADMSAHSKSRGQPFAVGLVVAVPAAQGGVAGVGKKILQRRQFNVAVAKDLISSPRF
jgi:hypothetical protein